MRKDAGSNTKFLTQFLSGLLILFFIYHIAEFYDSFLLMAITKIGIIPVAWLLAKWQGWKGLGGYGLIGNRSAVYNCIAGLLIAFAFYLLYQGITVAAGWERIQPMPDIPTVVSMIPQLLFMTLFPSLAEDLLTRGYLFAHLSKKFSSATIIFLSASFFLLNHIWRLNDGADVLIYLFIMGILLAWTVYRTQSLWLAFGLHWGLNIGFEFVQQVLHPAAIDNQPSSNWIYATILAFLIFFLKAIDSALNKQEWPERES